MRHIQKHQPLIDLSKYAKANDIKNWEGLPFNVRKECRDFILEYYCPIKMKYRKFSVQLIENQQ